MYSVDDWWFIIIINWWLFYWNSLLISQLNEEHKLHLLSFSRIIYCCYMQTYILRINPLIQISRLEIVPKRNHRNSKSIYAFVDVGVRGHGLKEFVNTCTSDSSIPTPTAFICLRSLFLWFLQISTQTNTTNINHHHSKV